MFRAKLRTTVVTAAATAALAAVATVPALAGTTTTMTVTGVTITEPLTAALVAASGNTGTFSLGLTTVTDIGSAGYTVAIKSGDFKTADSSATILASKLTACIPDATGDGADVTLVTDGSVAPTVDTTATVVCTAQTGTLDTARTLLKVTGGDGTTETGEYNPTIKVDLTNAGPGIYSGTITQTVS